MKIIPVFLIFLLCSYSLHSQTNPGLDALNSGMFQSAKSYFRSQLANPQARQEACYYLGEAYHLSGKIDSACFYYELGLTETVPGVLCMVGKACLLMKTDPGQAEELIKKAQKEKKYRNSPALYVAIAKAYSENRQFGKAHEFLNIAKENNKKYTDTYLAEGDVLLQEEPANIGNAVTKYESAAYFDPACKPAYLKVAQIYFLARNFDLSSQYLSKIKAIDSHFPPYLKLLGDISYEQGKYADAVSAYNEYLQSPEAGLNDQVRYSYALFFNKDYQQSLNEIKTIIPHDPDNLVLRRLLAYNSFETGDFDKGLEQIQEFFRVVKPSDIISSDFKYYALLLGKNNQDSLSIVNYLKAVALSDTPNELYKGIALTYEKMKKYDESASYLGKFIKSTDKPENSDLFFWGRDCYFAAGAIDTAGIASKPEKAEVRKALLTKADSIFSIVISHVPDNYLGYLWRARVNAMSDPETERGLAKPYYEQVAAILEQAKNNKNELLESYQYLGYYYYLKKDMQNSLTFWNKIFAIDPGNTVARQAIKGIK